MSLLSHIGVALQVYANVDDDGYFIILDKSNLNLLQNWNISRWISRVLNKPSIINIVWELCLGCSFGDTEYSKIADFD